MRFLKSFFLRPTLTVAQELLGQKLIRRIGEDLLVGEITEVEAYVGEDDPACHARSGKTNRNSSMYLSGGHAYVYFTYGMHHCLNIVTEREGYPAAVLIRAIRPLEGIETMRRLCGKSAEIPEEELTNGPGKLCRAFGITRALNGIDLTTSNDLWLEKTDFHPQYIATPRIGIREGTDKLWRFATCSTSESGTGSTMRSQRQ